MPDYKALYLDLLKDVSRVIEQLQDSQNKSLKKYIKEDIQTVDENDIDIFRDKDRKGI